MITTYFNRDVYGNFINKQKVVANYTRALGDKKVKWNNAFYAETTSESVDFQNGTKLDYMEGFCYVPSEEMLKQESFEGFPSMSIHAQNMVWDMMGLEHFAWNFWGKLKLNETYFAKESNSKLDLAGAGSFENKDIQLSWIGITTQNNEVCAVIEFRVFNNPLELNSETIKTKGRSNYWGRINVSLKDKQIEGAVLFEDVVQEIKFSGQEKGMIMDTFREIKLERLNPGV
ncbi:MAG: hypothetical protein HC831_11135 [Chloroflexia bacterium]|nr:hypothetical protein [Chloroflexia bacterium]